MQPVNLRLTMIVETGWECIRIIENTDRDIDTFGPRFKAEAYAAAAGGTEPPPPDIAGIVAAQLTVPSHLAALESRKRRDCRAGCLAAHRAVAMCDAAGRRRGFKV